MHIYYIMRRMTSDGVIHGRKSKQRSEPSFVDSVTC